MDYLLSTALLIPFFLHFCYIQQLHCTVLHRHRHAAMGCKTGTNRNCFAFSTPPTTRHSPGSATDTRAFDRTNCYSFDNFTHFRRTAHFTYTVIAQFLVYAGTHLCCWPREEKKTTNITISSKQHICPKYAPPVSRCSNLKSLSIHLGFCGVICLHRYGCLYWQFISFFSAITTF